MHYSLLQPAYGGSRPARCTPRSVPDTCLGSRRPDWSIDMENVIPPFEITTVCTEEATGSYLCFPNIRKKTKNGTTNRYSFCCIRTKCDCNTTRFSFDAICLCANRPKVDGAMWSEQPSSKFAGVVRIEQDGDCNLNFVPRKQANFDKRRRHEHRQNLYTASYNICVRTTKKYSFIAEYTSCPPGLCRRGHGKTSTRLSV